MDALFLKFSTLVFWHWFALAIVLWILDVLMGANFLFVWCGFAAVLVGVFKLVFPPMTWEYQFLMFGIGVLASLVIWRHFFKKQQKESDTPNLNRRSQQLVGRHFTLDTPIIDGRGKIRVDDTWWRVAGDDMPLGAKVRVIDVDGVVLKVEKI